MKKMKNGKNEKNEKKRKGTPHSFPQMRGLRHCNHSLWEVSDQHFQNSSYSPFEIHICCGEAGPKPRDRHARISARTNALGLKAIASQNENNLHIMHAWTPTYIVLHMLQTVWIVVQMFAQRLVQIFWHNKEFAQVVSTELLLAFHHSCITSSRSSTFPDSLRSAPLYSIQFQSTNRRLVSKFHQLVSRFGMTLCHLSTWPLLTWPLTSGVPRSPTRSVWLVLNEFCCCCNCW